MQCYTILGITGELYRVQGISNNGTARILLMNIGGGRS